MLTFDKPHSPKVNWLTERPIAHRGLHDASNKVFENTLSACAAAIRRDYAIEVDLQPSADGVPMVFHDYELDRMTTQKGDVREITSNVLAKINIMGTDDRIPTLADLLDLVSGEVGLVLELKGKTGADDGFVAAVAKELETYDGPVVIMSFHHHLLEDARAIAPDLPLGLTAYGDDSKYAQHLEISQKTNPDFLSYELKNLDTKFVSEFNKTGRPVISWTVKSEADAAKSARYAKQPTFEGFLP
jgi:glycerophosphoryl diester phosphodiesterase